MIDASQLALEEAALHAVLHRSDSTVAARLTAAHFTDPTLQRLFTAAAGSVLAGAPIDLYDAATTAAASNCADTGAYLSRASGIVRDVFWGQTDTCVLCDRLDERLQSRQVAALGRALADAAANGDMSPHERLDLLRSIFDTTASSINVASQRASATQKMAQMKMTSEQVEWLEDAVAIVPDLIIHGHIIVIAAQANGGKSTLFHYLSGQMASSGYNVLYIHADTSGGDAKRLWTEAEEMGYHLITPDLNNIPIAQVQATLEEMARSTEDLSRTVLIFDTMKKFVDMLSKGGVKAFFSLCRRLTGKGATIILLAHTNKYLDENGFPVFEGVGDVRNDTDELIYLIPKPNDDGSMTLSTRVDKVRGKLHNITYQISSDRRVRRDDAYIDVARLRVKEQALEEQAAVIEAIETAIRDGSIKQKDILAACAEASISKRQAMRALNDFSRPPGQRFYTRRGMENNVIMYSLTPW